MMKMKLSQVAKELPYSFKWKDHWYILNGERYFRVDDNWEPYFYLYQLDEEVETSLQNMEESKFQEIPLFKGTMEQLDNLTILKEEGKE